VLFNSLLSVVRNRHLAGHPGQYRPVRCLFHLARLRTVPYLMQVHDMARPVAASHLSLWFGGFAVGCLLLGTLSDWSRRKPVIIVASHIYGAIWLLLLAGVRMPVEVSYALFAVLGLATASFSLTWACAKEVNPPMLSGMSTSVTNMGSFLAAPVPAHRRLGHGPWLEGRDGGRGACYDLAAWRGGLGLRPPWP
jgi:multidrug transporter EmrE-like cation transporter